MEVTDEVFESKFSKVFDQAENRLHTSRPLWLPPSAANNQLSQQKAGPRAAFLHYNHIIVCALSVGLLVLRLMFVKVRRSA